MTALSIHPAGVMSEGRGGGDRVGSTRKKAGIWTVGSVMGHRGHGPGFNMAAAIEVGGGQW